MSQHAVPAAIPGLSENAKFLRFLRTKAEVDAKSEFGEVVIAKAPPKHISLVLKWVIQGLYSYILADHQKDD